MRVGPDAAAAATNPARRGAGEGARGRLVGDVAADVQAEISPAPRAVLRDAARPGAVDLGDLLEDDLAPVFPRAPSSSVSIARCMKLSAST
jgi:hypothetical protein